MLVQREKSAHYYLRDGTPFYEVPCKSRPGQMRPVKIGDAIEAGAVPSVTTKLAVLRKFGLEAWKLEQCVMSALTLPKAEGESIDDFAKRIVADMDEEANAAADMGTRLHDACAAYACEGIIPSQELLPMFTPFQQWFDENVIECPMCEHVLVNEEYGYAGRMDMLANVRGHGWSICDIKTQNRKGKKFVHYPEWPLQLAAYAAALKGGYTLMNICLDRSEPGLEIKVWDNGAQYWKAFLAVSEIWNYLKGV